MGLVLFHRRRRARERRLPSPSFTQTQLFLFECEAVSNQNTQEALDLPEKEVIQPHLPVRLPCYDFTPVTRPSLRHTPPCG